MYLFLYLKSIKAACFGHFLAFISKRPPWAQLKFVSFSPVKKLKKTCLRSGRAGLEPLLCWNQFVPAHKKVASLFPVLC